MKTPTNLKFGQSAEVRRWEAKQARQEKIESLQDEDFFILPQDEAREIVDKAWDLGDPDSQEPVHTDATRALYDLIFDEDQEPRRGMTAHAEAFLKMQVRLLQLQSVLLKHLKP